MIRPQRKEHGNSTTNTKLEHLPGRTSKVNFLVNILKNGVRFRFSEHLIVNEEVNCIGIGFRCCFEYAFFQLPPLALGSWPLA